MAWNILPMRFRRMAEGNRDGDPPFGQGIATYSAKSPPGMIEPCDQPQAWLDAGAGASVGV